MTDGTTLWDKTIKRGMAKLLGVGVASNSASLEFSSGLNLTEFESYLWDIDNLFINAAEQNLAMQVMTGGFYQASGYTHYATALVRTSGLTAPEYYGAVANGVGWTSQFLVGIGVSSTNPMSGRVRLIGDPRKSTVYKNFLWHTNQYYAPHGMISELGGGFFAGSTGPIEQVKFFFDAGAVISQGAIRFYGLRKG